MLTIMNVIGWGLVGSVSAFVLTFLGLLAFNSIVPRSGSDELGAWGWGDFALLMGSPWAGFLPGVIYGIVRACNGREAEAKSAESERSEVGSKNNIGEPEA